MQQFLGPPNWQYFSAILEQGGPKSEGDRNCTDIVGIANWIRHGPDTKA